MSVVMFYHLKNMPLLDTARALLARAQQMEWRVMVRGGDLGQLKMLDHGLWAGAPDSFLAHGLEGSGHDSDQPILLGQGAAVNDAKAIMLVGGSPVNLEEAQKMQRVWLLFDGYDEMQMAQARQEWRAVVGAGLEAQYWSDQSGRWEKVTQSSPAKADQP